MFNMRNKTGFTLAEVLITLLIVGVIASIVIPGLIANTQQAEYKAAWKKAFASLNQATLRLSQENAGNLTGTYTTDDLLTNAYCSYLNCIKVCATGSSLGNCWTSTAKSLGGNPVGWSNNAGAILNDGTLLRLGASIGTNATIGAFSAISIDVNGFKEPNTIGKDVFYVWILKNTIKPWGTQGDGFESDCNTSPASGIGYGCSARYLNQ